MLKVELSGIISRQELQMEKTRFTETHIIAILKEVEAGMLIQYPRCPFCCGYKGYKGTKGIIS